MFFPVEGKIKQRYLWFNFPIFPILASWKSIIITKPSGALDEGLSPKTSYFLELRFSLFFFFLKNSKPLLACWGYGFGSGSCAVQQWAFSAAIQILASPTGSQRDPPCLQKCEGAGDIGRSNPCVCVCPPRWTNEVVSDPGMESVCWVVAHYRELLLATPQCWVVRATYRQDFVIRHS